MLANSTILVTGGTGSFGSTFLQRVLREDVQAVRVYSRDELKQHELRQRIDDKRVRFLIGDVRDLDRLTLATKGCDVIVHAAALKQVPLCEYNPFEAVQTNIVGAQNVVTAAIANSVPRTIALSSDKAVNPVNIYGATKLCAEKIVSQANAYAGDTPARFSTVRYGNVMGSRGSVIPLFKKQAQDHECERCHGEGEIRWNPGYPDPQTEDVAPCGNCGGRGVVDGEITLTDEAMTRFFMTLERSVEFVLDCLERMQGGEVFVPKMPSMRITELAKAIAPGGTQRIVGIRPGEKIHETLLTADESRHATEFEDHFSILPSFDFRNVDYKLGMELPPGFAYSSDSNTEWLTADELSHLDSIRPSLAGHGG